MIFSRIKCSFIPVIIVIFCFCHAPLLAQEKKQEVVVTIEGISSDEKLEHFERGEMLRKKMKFAQAIEEYKQVIGRGEVCGKESEAHYNIGLCYTWLLDMDKAKETFQEVIESYPDDGMAQAYGAFGLAWVATRQGRYDDAIARLRRELDKGTCPDQEHCAVMQFHIGRIYVKYLKDFHQAETAFQNVLNNYPHSEIANHPYLDYLKRD